MARKPPLRRCLDRLDKDIGGVEPDIVLLDAHGRERRRQPVDQRHVVVARHRNVARAIEPAPAEGGDRPDRQPVVRADDRSELDVAAKELLRAGGTLVLVEGGGEGDERPVAVESERAPMRLEGAVALDAGRQ